MLCWKIAFFQSCCTPKFWYNEGVKGRSKTRILDGRKAITLALILSVACISRLWYGRQRFLSSKSRFLYAHWVHKVSEQHGSSCHRFRIYERHFLTLILYKVTTRVVLPQPRKMWPLFSPPRTNTISLSPGRNPLSTSGRNVITLNIRWKKNQ